MSRKWFLVAGVADLYILNLLDRLAFRYFFYWRYPWFDILMHLLGGLAIGLVSTFAYFAVQPEGSRKAGGLLKLNLLFALVIGAAWEIFELAADRIVRFDWLSTTGDVFFGILGSLSAGSLVAIWLVWNKRLTEKN